MTTETVGHLDAVGAFGRIARPRSVVLIGASGRDGAMASIPARNLSRYGFGGTVYLVNPGRKEIGGARCYPDPASLPEVPDTAVILVRAAEAFGALESCAAVGIRTATLVASGLTEGAAGDDCARNLGRLEEIIATTGIRVMGPNTAGLVNVVDHYVPRASTNLIDPLVSGNVAIVSQSGALGTTVLNQAMLHSVGVSYAIGTGNQADLDVWDAVAFLIDDANTDVIVITVEGFKYPDKFRRVADLAVQVGKPLVVLKVGKSRAGGAVVDTHSGALAGEHQVQRAVLSRSGVVEVSELDQLWQVASLFQRWRWDGAPRRVRRLGIVAFSGGEAALAADAAESAGFDMPAPPRHVQRQLSSLFKFGDIRNPFDLTGQWVDEPELIGKALSAIETAAAVDAIILPMSVMPTSRAAAELIRWAREDRTGAIPVAVGMRHNAEDMTSVAKPLIDAGIAVLDSPEELLRALSLYDRYAESHPGALSRSAARPAIDRGRTRGEPVGSPDCSYWRARQILAALDLPFNAAFLVRSKAEAASAVVHLSFPVTVKVSKVDISHKAAAGGVADLLMSAKQVEQTVARMLGFWEGSRPDGDEGLVLESYVASRLQVFVGAQRDPEFGPVALFGLGGAYAERYGDVRVLPLPADPAEISESIATTKIGQVVLDLNRQAFDRCVEIVSRVGEWFTAIEGVQAVDLNPLLIDGHGKATLVDARISWRKEAVHGARATT